MKTYKDKVLFFKASNSFAAIAIPYTNTVLAIDGNIYIDQSGSTFTLPMKVCFNIHGIKWHNYIYNYRCETNENI